MDEPVDYGARGRLSRADARARAGRRSRRRFHSNWLDNSKARHLLGWRPEVDLRDAHRAGLGLQARPRTNRARSGTRADQESRPRQTRERERENEIDLRTGLGPGADRRRGRRRRTRRRWRSSSRASTTRSSSRSISAARSGWPRTPDSEYECLYTGPASSADEAGEVQIVDDLSDQRRRRHRHFAVQRAGHGQPHPPDRAERAGHDHRRRLPREGPRSAHRPISAPTTT